MNLLVTGGCGFIGSNFINYYFHTNTDCRIINIDALYYCANILNVSEDIRNSNRYTLIPVNLTDEKYYLKDILLSFNIDHVIHFAAQSHVQTSFSDSLQYTKDNILGTHMLLEACRVYGKIKRFIHISTDEVYGESMISKAEHKKTEESILCPTNPYAATKASAELIAQSYYHSFKMPIIITRGNNVYGPNQYPEKLIPYFIQCLKAGKKVPIQGNGENLRAFIHVNDVCSGLQIILDHGKVGEIYNIGSDDDSELSVLEVAKFLINKICFLNTNTLDNDYDHWIEYVEDRPFNDKRYFISNEKLKNLSWEIKVSFKEGISSLLKL